MNHSAVCDFLSKLLNRSVSPEASVSLSSAQRARLAAWLEKQGIAVDDVVMRGQFSVERLIGGDQGSRAPTVPQDAGPVPMRTEAGLAMRVGIDMQQVAELFPECNLNDFKADPALTRIFTLRELSYAQSAVTPKETLAGIFAAKEAMRKCLRGPALSAEQFRSLEVLPDEWGKPCAPGFELSISHSGGMAVAVALKC